MMKETNVSIVNMVVVTLSFHDGPVFAVYPSDGNVLSEFYYRGSKMKKLRSRLLVLFLASCVGFTYSPAFAGTILFTDNFNAENGGTYKLNYAGFTNWTITNGTVDLIGLGSPWNFFPSYGLFVDLDGSTNDPGTMTSISFNLTPGKYQFQFDLAGSQRPDVSNQVAVNVVAGPLFSTTYTLSSSAPFSTFTAPFTVTSAGSYRISFQNNGTDNMGALLDNVRLIQVPEATLVLLLGVGLGAVTLLAWRWKI